MKCPLCHNLLKGPLAPALYCDTYVDVGPNTRWGHFVRKPDPQKQEQNKHMAIIPPFYIYWWETDQRVLVQIFGVDPSNWRIQNTIYEADNIDQKEILRLYKKFSKLKAFS